MAEWQTICLPMQETPETQVWPLGWDDTLGKEITTYSNILAWKISWTKKPGRLTVHGAAKS